jgi:hypothetical protein
MPLIDRLGMERGIKHTVEDGLRWAARVAGLGCSAPRTLERPHRRTRKDDPPQ